MGCDKCNKWRWIPDWIENINTDGAFSCDDIYYSCKESQTVTDAAIDFITGQADESEYVVIDSTKNKKRSIEVVDETKTDHLSDNLSEDDYSFGEAEFGEVIFERPTKKIALDNTDTESAGFESTPNKEALELVEMTTSQTEPEIERPENHSIKKESAKSAFQRLIEGEYRSLSISPDELKIEDFYNVLNQIPKSPLKRFLARKQAGL